jgi:hypothetical protein
MHKPLTRAFLALVISLFLIAPVALAQEPVTGPMVRHQNAAFVRTMVRHQNAAFVRTMVRHQNAAFVRTMVRHRNAAFVQAMVRHVAQTHGIPADRLKVGHETSNVLPLTGKTLYMVKILDTATGKAYGVAADETGTIVDADALRDAERRAFAARYGKPSPFRGAIPMARSRPDFSSGWRRRAVTRPSPSWCGWTTAARCRLRRA